MEFKLYFVVSYFGDFLFLQPKVPKKIPANYKCFTVWLTTIEGA